MRRGFTLIEMLVVIGIVAVLVALLVPAGAIAISSARNASMSLEIAQLAQAIETYKNDKGDYPPSFGEIDVQDLNGNGNRLESLYVAAPYTSVVERHLRKCYPKMTPQEKTNFYAFIALNIDQSESLVFWLSQTYNDERNPFFSTSGNLKKYYDFKVERVIPTKVITLPFANSTYQFNAYKPAYAKETGFVYLDSRTYIVHGDIDRAAPFIPLPSPFARNYKVQPYFDDQTAVVMNRTTFQIICAGQDGEFGEPVDMLQNNFDPAIGGFPVIPNSFKRFKSGVNYTDEDMDNLTNFSEGKELGDHIP